MRRPLDKYAQDISVFNKYLWVHDRIALGRRNDNRDTAQSFFRRRLNRIIPVFAIILKFRSFIKQFIKPFTLTMKKIAQDIILLFFSFSLLISCKGKINSPSGEALNAINLKRGEVVLCGPADKQFGVVEFETSCTGKVKKDIDLAIALLHSFEYDEAEKVFAKIID